MSVIPKGKREPNVEGDLALLPYTATNVMFASGVGAFAGLSKAMFNDVAAKAHVAGTSGVYMATRGMARHAVVLGACATGYSVTKVLAKRHMAHRPRLTEAMGGAASGLVFGLMMRSSRLAAVFGTSMAGVAAFLAEVDTWTDPGHNHMGLPGQYDPDRPLPKDTIMQLGTNRIDQSLFDNTPKGGSHH